METEVITQAQELVTQTPARVRKQEYRYQDRVWGSTRHSVRHFHHCARIGRILYVKGIKYRTKTGSPMTKVIVRGTKGYCSFAGLMWGYEGQGPRGLASLLAFLGLRKFGAAIVAATPLVDVLGTHWKLAWDHSPHASLNGAAFKVRGSKHFTWLEMAGSPPIALLQ